MKIAGVVLAGGRSRRMGGGDKALRTLGGVTLLERAVERLRRQVEAMVLNANGDPARFARFALEVVPDNVPGFAGPLAGVLAGLDWTAQHRPDCNFIVSVATDAPFFPTDLVARLWTELAAEGADLACAVSSGRAHPTRLCSAPAPAAAETPAAYQSSGSAAALSRPVGDRACDQSLTNGGTRVPNGGRCRRPAVSAVPSQSAHPGPRIQCPPPCP